MITIIWMDFEGNQLKAHEGPSVFRMWTPLPIMIWGCRPATEQRGITFRPSSLECSPGSKSFHYHSVSCQLSPQRANYKNAKSVPKNKLKWCHQESPWRTGWMLLHWCRTASAVSASSLPSLASSQPAHLGIPRGSWPAEGSSQDGSAKRSWCWKNAPLKVSRKGKTCYLTT